MKSFYKKICAIFVSILFVNVSFASNIIYTNQNTNNGLIIGPGYEVNSTFENNSVTTSIGSNVYVHDGIRYTKSVFMGNFSLSGYCACEKCGSGTGLTASGHPVRENHTISADWSILPKGTMIIIEDAVGKDGTSYDGVYEVEDKGGGIKKYKIDIYRPTHDLAALVTYYGKCNGKVYIAVPLANE